MNQVMNNKLEEYKNWLIANGKSANTIYQYMPYIRKFLESIKVNELSEITQSSLLSYLAQEFPKYTQCRHNQLVGAIKQFCQYNDVLHLKFPKTKVAVSQRIKKPITEDELKVLNKRLIDIFTDYEEVKPLIYFLFYSGLRRQEVINLKRKDIKFEENKVTVWIPKQNIYREVYLPKNLQTVLKGYFATIQEQDNAFNTSKNKIHYMMQKIRESEVLGKGRKIWNHLWRDSFACMCLEKGMDIYELQKLMGHKSIETTAIYVTMCSDTVKQKFLHLIKGIL